MLAHVFIITPRRAKSRGFLKNFSVKCNKLAGSPFSVQKTCNGPRNVLFYKKGAPPGGARKKGPRFGTAPSVSQKRHALGGTHFFPLISPWGQNLAPNRALGLAASHTPGAKGCRCPNFRRTSQRARKFGRRPQLRFACFCHWQRLSFAVLYVSRPSAHVGWTGLF